MHLRFAVVTFSAIGILLSAALGAGCGSSGSSATSGPSSTSSSSKTAKPAKPSWAIESAYAPTIDPANFVATIDNPYFPLPVGTTFHFKGTADGKPQTDDMVVTDKTKTILGVTCTVVDDTVSENGNAIERTADWFAQDKEGNVWYMGEDSFEKDHGRFVKANDSWEAGVDGAQPGIIMPAHPKPGDTYRQEYYKPGGALDQARVVRVNAHADVAYGSFDNVVVTAEWGPADPSLEEKRYASGVGEIEEHITAGGNEQFELVSVTHA